MSGASPDRPDPILALFIRVESGTTEPGPPLRVRAGPIESGDALDTPDLACDVIVVTIEDCMATAAGHILDRLFPAMPALAEHLIPVEPVHKSYAFKVGDARALCIALLHHLAATGEPVARGIMQRLHPVIREINQERGEEDGGDNPASD